MLLLFQTLFGTPRRALILVSGIIYQVPIGQEGTGKKALVWYNGNIVERSAAEGIPIIWDGTTLRQILDSETLLV